jgi:hypothetical protein
VGLMSGLARQAIWLRVNVNENLGKKGSNTKRRLQYSEEGQDKADHYCYQYKN